MGSDDTIAPVTSVSVSGTSGSNGWYRSAIAVTLSATDSGGSGLAGTYYAVDGGSFTAYSSAIGLSTDGTHALTYYSTDLVGNIESSHVLTLKIDTTAPVTTATVSGLNVTLSSSDAVSGSATIYYPR